jgi:DNA helicase II / ATP-dependent DNA helicase PcrA
MSVAHLEKLNPKQRRAVEHGVLEECAPAAPLLVIAGAGSGKTNTLAHRVAHLIINGADARRILLMTFSRRAATEMAYRAERICSQALGAKAGVMTDALAWAGTFHAIGARLLREYAEQIGLDPNFTIHDREDNAKLVPRQPSSRSLPHAHCYSRRRSRGPLRRVPAQAANPQG